MVNLNRQIGVSQARQGGFSSHVLPEPVGYQPPQPQVIYVSGGRTRTSGGMLYSAWNQVTRNYAPGEDVYVDLLSPSFGGETVAVSEWFWTGFSFQNRTAFRARVYDNTAGPFGEPVTAPVGILKIPFTPVAGHISSGPDGRVNFPIDEGSDWTLEGWSRTVGTGGEPIGAWVHSAVCRRLGEILAWVGGSATTTDTVAASLNQISYGWDQPDRVSIAGKNVDYLGQRRFSPFARYSGTTITIPTAPFIAV